MSRRKVLLAAVPLALVLAAVSASAAFARPAKRQATTITLTGWASSPAETDLLKQTIAAFEARNPDIKVNYAPINGDYEAAMLAKFAARTPPDVFYVDSNVAPTWIRQGVLEPLDSFVRSTRFNTSKFYPKLLGAFRSGGRTYGFPKDWSPLALEVNTKMFAKAKIKVMPSTWQGLYAAAVKLNNMGAVPGNGKPICLAPDWARMLAFVYQNGGSFLNASKTRATVNSPKVAAAVNYYIRFLRRGLAATPQQLGVGWCGEALGKQKAAIIMEGNWVVSYMKDQFPTVGYKIIPMVHKAGRSGFGNLAFTVSYSMGRDSDHKSEAWKLISFLTGQQGMRIWTSKGLALPSRSDVKPLGGRSAFLSQAPYAHPWQFAPGFSKVIDTANNELTAVFNNKQTVSGMLKKVQDAANSALAGG